MVYKEEVRPVGSTAHPPERPLLLWDGQCGFCRRAVDRLVHQVGDRIEPVPFQEGADRVPDLDPAAMARAAHLVLPDGRVYVGAHAILRAGKLDDRAHPVLWLYEHLRPVAWIADRVYGWIAGHRVFAARAARALVGPDLLPRQYRLTRWLFLRLLGLAALAAFLSLYVQVDGLVGPHGIVPAHDYLAARSGGDWFDRLTIAPTLLRVLGTLTAMLQAFCLAGALLALLLVADVAPGPSVLGIWILYLSLVVVCAPFLPFQWDTLLLETLLAALFVAPWRLRPRLATDREPALAGVWVLRLLAFKLIVMSGLVKLLSHDPTWRDLTALDYHFYTQPIPTWMAWKLHQAPAWLHRVGVVFTFAVELVLPWLLFGPRRARMLFAGGAVLLMLFVGATGNYGFFNLLSIAILVMLVDDALLRRLVPRRLRARVPDPAHPAPRPPRRRVRRTAIACAIPFVLLGGLRCWQRLDRDFDPPGPVRELLARTYRLHSTNAYGLFEVMTTARPEVQLEGSRDGRTWTPYRFRWKVGDVDEVPGVTGLHMPRLDWQMWFAALSSCRSPNTTWLRALLQRLLQGEPSVLELLAVDPFAGDPPRYVRAVLYEYAFASDARHVEQPDDVGRVWKRRQLGPYCPAATLAGGRLMWVQFN